MSSRSSSCGSSSGQSPGSEDDALGAELDSARAMPEPARPPSGRASSGSATTSAPDGAGHLLGAGLAADDDRALDHPRLRRSRRARRRASPRPGRAGARPSTRRCQPLLGGGEALDREDGDVASSRPCEATGGESRRSRARPRPRRGGRRRRPSGSASPGRRISAGGGSGSPASTTIAVDQPGVEGGDAGGGGRAADAAHEAVGRALDDLAGDVGADRDDRARRAAAIASRTPGTARIGPMLITGLEGPMTIASASRRAASDLRGRAAASDPLELDPSHLGLAAVDDQVLLQAAPGRRRCGPASGPAASLIGRTLRRDPEAAGDLAPGRRSCVPPSARNWRPVEAGGEVAVGEAEPVRGAERGRGARRR